MNNNWSHNYYCERKLKEEVVQLL